jgi:hypothetical protein
MANVVCSARVAKGEVELWDRAAALAAYSRGGIIAATIESPTCPTHAVLRDFRSIGPFPVKVSFRISRDTLKALRRLGGRAMTQGEAVRRLLLFVFRLWLSGCDSQYLGRDGRWRRVDARHCSALHALSPTLRAAATRRER